MNSVKTEKGTVLPLVSLKGKDYLQVAYRLQWLTERYARYTIDTNVLALTEEGATVRSQITVLDESGNVIRSATGTKSETKRDFADFLEKAETGSLGRALAMIGLGTQHAVADLDEGDRLADAPLESKKTISASEAKAATKAAEVPAAASVEGTSDNPDAKKKPSMFKRSSSAKAAATSNVSNGASASNGSASTASKGGAF